MANTLDLMLEAEKRGILPPDRKAMLDEARKRGIVPGAEPVTPTPSSVAPEVGAIEGGARALARGVPVIGAFADELNAATNAALQPIIPESIASALGGEKIPGETFSERYENELARQRGMDKSFDAAHPVASPALQVAGGVASGAAALKAAPAAAKVALGMGGRTMAGKTMASAASGAGLGLGHGFGSGEGDIEDRLAEGAKGAAVGGALAATFPALASGLGKIWDRFTKVAAPTLDNLKQQAGRLYKKADNIGLVITKNSADSAVADLNATLTSAGFRPRMHPKVSVALDEIAQDAAKGDLTLQQLQQLRRVAQAAGKSAEPDEQRLGGILVGKIDAYMENLKPGDVVSGDAEQASAVLKQARNLWSRYRKGEVIENLLERAEISAPNFSGSGAENAIRTEFRALAKNAKKMRMFTEEEQAAIKKVAKGGPLGNTLRMLGKFAPTGIVSTALSGGTGAAIGGPLGAVALPVAGLAARQGATAVTLGNARAASELVRRGAPAAPSAAANALARFTQGTLQGAAPALGQQMTPERRLNTLPVR